MPACVVCVIGKEIWCELLQKFHLDRVRLLVLPLCLIVFSAAVHAALVQDKHADVALHECRNGRRRSDAGGVSQKEAASEVTARGKLQQAMQVTESVFCIFVSAMLNM